MIHVKAIAIHSLAKAKTDITFRTLKPGFDIIPRLGFNSINLTKITIFVLVILKSSGHVF